MKTWNSIMTKELTKWENVNGYNPEREIWSYYITKLTNPHFVRTLIGKKVNNALYQDIKRRIASTRDIRSLQNDSAAFKANPSTIHLRAQYHVNSNN